METIKTKVETEGKEIRFRNGRGHYGHVIIVLTPLERGQGYRFENQVRGGRIPDRFIPAVEQGALRAVHAGSPKGYRLTDLSCTVYDGSFHDVDSSEEAFEVAAFRAVRNAIEKAGCVSIDDNDNPPTVPAGV